DEPRVERRHGRVVHAALAGVARASADDDGVGPARARLDQGGPMRRTRAGRERPGAAVEPHVEVANPVDLWAHPAISIPDDGVLDLDDLHTRLREEVAGHRTG